MEDEIWKEYKGLIEVSNYGNVRSLDRIRVQVNRWGKPFNVLHKGKMLKLHKGSTGYYIVSISNGEEKQYQSIHRLVALLFCEIPDSLKDTPLNKLHVDHIDGDKLNNNYTNLRWVTPKENSNNPVTLEFLRKAMSTEEYKEKISKAHKGKIVSEETKRKMSEKMKGRKMTDEQRKKMSEIRKTLPISAEHREKMLEGLRRALKGKPMSEEQKKKISESNKGKKMSEDFKKKMAEIQRKRKGIPKPSMQKGVNVFKDGLLIKTFEKVTDAQKEYPSVCACLKGKRKKSKGCTFEYIQP